MYLLAIETTGAFASVSLMRDSQILGVIHGNDRFSHLQNLTPQIKQLLEESALQIGDIGAIAVSHGPGSFTGIRIGVSTARALAQILHIPCIPVSSLEGLALRAEEAEEDVLLCPALDARRKQVYGAAYEIVGDQLVCRIPPASCLMTEFLDKIDAYRREAGFAAPRRIHFLGDGIDTCGQILEDWQKGHPETDGPAFAEVSYAPEESRYQDAASVALRGWQLYREGRTCEYMQLQPEYLRMAEAEKKLRDKLAAEKESHE